MTVQCKQQLVPPTPESQEPQGDAESKWEVKCPCKVIVKCSTNSWQVTCIDLEPDYALPSERAQACGQRCITRNRQK